MALDWLGEWDGVCACGKTAEDGIQCFLGATHAKPQPMPWETLCSPAPIVEPLSTSQTSSLPLFPWSGVTETGEQ